MNDGVEDKPRIAYITIGGFGTGSFSQGIPILNAFIDEMKKHYAVTVFSLSPVNDGYKASGYEVYAPKYKKHLYLSIPWLIFNFSKNHFLRKFSLIHAFWGYPSGMMAVILKFIFRIPTLIHLQGGDSCGIAHIGYGVYASIWKTRVVNYIYKRCDVLVVLTHYQKKQLQKHFRSKRPYVISYGTNLKKEYEGVANENAKSSKTRHLIHIAHMNKVKDQETLLNAFKLVREIKAVNLDILGSDTLDGSLQHYAKQLGLADFVTFHGIVPHNETLSMLRSAKLLIHTSLYEAQCMSATEALALSVPVIGTSVGLIADLQGVCTFATPLGDSRSLAENIVKLLENQTLYEETVQSGLRWSEENSLVTTIEKFRMIYNRYLQQD